MSREIQINDVIVFNPESFEASRMAALPNNWIYCDGVKPWRGSQVPFVAIASFVRPPLGNEMDVLKPDVGGWIARDLEWVYVPCDASSCMLVVELEGAYVKLLPLNEDYRPPIPIDKHWVSSSVLQHGLDVGILQVLP